MSPLSSVSGTAALAAFVGVGWRAPHEQALMQEAVAPPAFIEVHSENFFAPGGAALATLCRARERYPVSLHGVGLALGSAAGLDPWHLDRLAALVERVEPMLVSDHACFARVPAADGGPAWHGSDLLPIAFNGASLALMARHVQQVQERLSRPLLVEHLSASLRATPQAQDLSEPEFFNALARQTGCRLLLDVNNLVVNALNDGAPDPVAAACRWIDALVPGIVGEIHLAGHDDTGPLVIDDHGSPVRDSVWAVYRHALARLGPRPTLVEWDTAVPPWSVLLAEASKAAQCQPALALGPDGAADMSAPGRPQARIPGCAAWRVVQ